MHRTLIVATMVCLSLPAAAQSRLQLAIKGGANAATQAEDNRVHRYGFSSGLAAQLLQPLSGRLSLGGQAELLYSPRGAETVFEGEHLGQVREHYLDFLLAARLEASFGTTSVFLLLGAGPCFLLSAVKEDNTGRKEYITDSLERVDVALLMGAGIALQLPQRELGPIHLSRASLEVRHDRGLLDTIDVNDGRGFKNRSMSLVIGLSFGLGAGPPKPPPAVKEPTPATARAPE